MTHRLGETNKGPGMGLDATSRPLVALSAALAARDGEALKRAMTGCVEAGASGGAEEVILQSYLFLGYPVALNAFGLWREVSGRDGGEGVPDDWEMWMERGEAVCRTVYGGQYQGLRRNVRALHPDMERWMVVEGYGKVLGRPGLPLAVRELCIGALLAVLVAPRQLYSHLRGALNAGASVEEVREALEVAREHLEEEEAVAMWSTWARVQERAGQGSPSMGEAHSGKDERG